MFHVEFLVEDKHLAAALRALSGIAIDLKPQPVAVVKNKKPESGSAYELFVKHMQGLGKGAKFTITHVRKFLLSIGQPESSAAYVIKRAAGEALIRKKGTGRAMSYEVMAVR